MEDETRQGSFYPHPATGSIRTCHSVALVDATAGTRGTLAVPSEEALAILDRLGEAIEVCGIPLALMTDNRTPFVTIVRSMQSRFRRTLAELDIRNIRAQIDTACSNDRINSFWAILQAEVLDRHTPS